MYPARTDSDRKRLRLALALSALVYGAAALAVALLPGVSRPAASPAALPAVTLRLSPGVASGSMSGNASGVVPNPDAASGAMPVIAREPAVSGVPAEAATPSPPAGTGSAQGEPGAAGMGARAGSAGPAGSVAHPGTGEGTQAASPEEPFLSWLDSAIRERRNYPERARLRRIEGTVTLRLDVSADGSLCSSAVVSSSGSALLDRSAVEMVSALFPSPVSPGTTLSRIIRIQYLLE